MDKTKVTKEGNVLILERVFNAPVDKLWDAFSNPETFVRWWGPEGWDTTVKEFDFVAGGKNHYCMKCVDEKQGEWFNQESWGMMVFDEVNAPTSFTYKDYFSDAEGTLNQDMPVITVTTSFIDQDGKTLMVNKSVAQSPEQIEELIKMGMLEGYSSSMDKLDTLLES